MAIGKAGSRQPLVMAGLALLVTTGLPGCSYIAGWFPDKQKEYRYSTELPPLEIPPDLISSTLEGTKTASEQGRYASTRRESDAEPDAESGAGSEEVERSTSRRASESDKTTALTAALAQGADEVPLIEVEAPFAETWNDVSRALGRLEVEISDQNRAEGVFYVYYGGDNKKYEDRGLWQDLASMFSDAGSKAKEFRLKLEDKDESTHVFIFDAEGNAVTEGPGLDLLKRLHEKLQNLDKPEPDQEKSEVKDES